MAGRVHWKDLWCRCGEAFGKLPGFDLVRFGSGTFSFMNDDLRIAIGSRRSCGGVEAVLEQVVRFSTGSWLSCRFICLWAVGPPSVRAHVPSTI